MSLSWICLAYKSGRLIRKALSKGNNPNKMSPSSGKSCLKQLLMTILDVLFLWSDLLQYFKDNFLRPFAHEAFHIDMLCR